MPRQKGTVDAWKPDAKTLEEIRDIEQIRVTLIFVQDMLRGLPEKMARSLPEQGTWPRNWLSNVHRHLYMILSTIVEAEIKAGEAPAVLQEGEH